MLLGGAKRYLGCIGNRRIFIDFVHAEHTLSLLHNLRLSPHKHMTRDADAQKATTILFRMCVLVRTAQYIKR